MISSSLRLAIVWSRPDHITATWTASWPRVPHIAETGPAIVAWLSRFIRHRSPTYEVERRIEEEGDATSQGDAGSVAARWQSNVIGGMLLHDDSEIIEYMHQYPIQPIALPDPAEDEELVAKRRRREQEALALIRLMRERLSLWTFDAPTICSQLMQRSTPRNETLVERSGIKVTTAIATSWRNIAVDVRCTTMLPFDRTAPRPMLWSVHGSGRQLVDRWAEMLQWLDAPPAQMDEASILVPTSMHGDIVYLDAVDHMVRYRWRDESTADQDVVERLVQMQERLVQASA